VAILAAVLLLCAVAGSAYMLMHSGAPVAPPAAAPVAETPPVSAPRAALVYSFTVQRFANGRPHGEPFSIAGNEVSYFATGDGVRIVVRLPREGHLYILNESPSDGTNGPRYRMLFPTPAINGGESRLRAGQGVEFPRDNWILFLKDTGTEKLWLVYSREAAPPFEAVKGAVNPRQLGLIDEPRRANAIVQFLERHGASAKQVVRDAETSKETTVTADADVVVDRLVLEHR
jgi:hypothetical protein